MAPRAISRFTDAVRTATSTADVLAALRKARLSPEARRPILCRHAPFFDDAVIDACVGIGFSAEALLANPALTEAALFEIVAWGVEQFEECVSEDTLAAGAETLRELAAIGVLTTENSVTHTLYEGTAVPSTHRDPAAVLRKQFALPVLLAIPDLPPAWLLALDARFATVEAAREAIAGHAAATPAVWHGMLQQRMSLSLLCGLSHVPQAVADPALRAMMFARYKRADPALATNLCLFAAPEELPALVLFLARRAPGRALDALDLADPAAVRALPARVFQPLLTARNPAVRGRARDAIASLQPALMTA